MDGILVKRSGKVLFYGVPGEDGKVVLTRATGFTDASTSKNPKEYSRQYIDEEFEQTDVVGYSPSTSYAFDYYQGNAVQEDIISISDKEKTGSEAVRTLVLVDIATKKAVKRDFAVIPDSEGDGTDAYTYSGTFKSKGAKVFGSVTTTDDFQTVEFTEDEAGE